MGQLKTILDNGPWKYQHGQNCNWKKSPSLIYGNSVFYILVGWVKLPVIKKDREACIAHICKTFQWQDTSQTRPFTSRRTERSAQFLAQNRAQLRLGQPIPTWANLTRKLYGYILDRAIYGRTNSKQQRVDLQWCGHKFSIVESHDS